MRFIDSTYTATLKYYQSEDAKRRFKHIARCILSLVPEGDQPALQTFLLQEATNEYADAAGAMDKILRQWEKTQDEMDVGL